MSESETEFPLPPWLFDTVSARKFGRWLDQKARTHVRRDRRRGNQIATVVLYKQAIYDAVLRCEGVDAITHAEMDWQLIGTYDSAQSKSSGRSYKRRFNGLPTLDHCDDGLGAPNFQICRWDTNDCKGDLEMDEFLSLCIQVLSAQGYKVSPAAD
ncbi:MAG: hypothetical protein P8J27_11400 [Mariniblastus sp.]|nr:hypothetical protein [Mariniblastus sp.]